ncbi:DUF11 domain-containing protein [Paenibacillus sp. 481]|uniref:DUF11 domain-containing protein n=1 Tax=Paenibacillus sp. 481 TaxID=2835869 RepID=UPI001E2B3FCE|nr:DUF11 domain-containing protein [Paenibacillus sp. 481]UHA71806.1 DUF11 domain-containing protein [Paenibacillus sp. 481]
MPPILQPVKLVNRTIAVPQQILTYTIVIINSGTDDALNVIFTDTIPAGSTFVVGSFSLNGVEQPLADPNVGVNIGTIAAGGFSTVMFKARVNCLSITTALDNQSVVTFGLISITSNTVTTYAVGVNQALLLIALEELNMAELINTQGELIQAAIQSSASITQLLEVNNNATTVLQMINVSECELVGLLQGVLRCSLTTP